MPVLFQSVLFRLQRYNSFPRASKRRPFGSPPPFSLPRGEGGLLTAPLSFSLSTSLGIMRSRRVLSVVSKNNAGPPRNGKSPEATANVLIIELLNSSSSMHSAFFFSSFFLKKRFSSIPPDFPTKSSRDFCRESYHFVRNFSSKRNQSARHSVRFYKLNSPREKIKFRIGHFYYSRAIIILRFKRGSDARISQDDVVIVSFDSCCF